MLLGLRLLLAHSATMQEENDKARNANRQNEDAQDNIVENEITTIDEQHEANDKARNFNTQNEKTTIDEQIRENKFSEISDERKENAASENRQRMQKIPLKLKKHATSRQMLFTPFEKRKKRSNCPGDCAQYYLSSILFVIVYPYLICL